MTTPPTTDWQEIESRYYMQTVRRIPVTLVRGEGSTVWDDQGREFLDFVGGWATATLGHSHPALVEAISKQAKTLIQVSNAFYTIPQIELAQLLIDNSCMDRVFFCNSGAEAVEGAVKVARRYGKLHRDGAYEVITALDSFHGRTLGMVAATGQPHYQEGFTPLTPGFVHVPYDSIDAIVDATTERTAAVLLEPVQGEGGVIVPSPNYLKAVREWCDRNNLLLLFDEVQTGIGRLGHLFGYQAFGVEPDVMALAKGLGGGVPIGAFLVKDRADALTYGDHGSTFGGNPLATAAGRAVMRTVLAEDIPGHVRRAGDRLRGRLQAMADRHSAITEVRGMGLLQAVQFNEEVAGDVLQACLDRGMLVNRVRPNAVRLMPPLIITDEDLDRGADILEEAVASVTG
jgi:predicted acetylornithine/succinylornithine family transaminase